LLIFVAAEVVLYVGYLSTKSKIVDVLVRLRQNNYPIDNSASYIKIAIFGGSSSAGYNSTLGFEQILRIELQKKYPLDKFYIKNYALNGAPFHRMQAELIKRTINHYDLFLIYSGHNELNNYFYYKNAFELVNYSLGSVPSLEFSFIELLENYSRIYSIVQKVRVEIENYIIHNNEASAIKEFTQFEYISKKIILPSVERTKITVNFEDDLQEISLLAKKNNKHIFISSARSNLEYWPMTSIFHSNLSYEQQNNFLDIYSIGLLQYFDGNYEDAITLFEKTKLIDDGVAVIDYLVGSSLLKTNKVEEGYRLLKNSLDKDGYPIRSISGVDRAIKTSTDKYNNMHYVDTNNLFYNAVKSGINFDELFSDIQHPSILGHAFIANAFLNKISNHSLLNKNIEKQNILTLISSYKELINYYKSRVSRKKEAYNAYMIARWHLGNYEVSHKNDMINASEKYLKIFYNKSNKTEYDKAFYLFMLSIVEVRKGDLYKSIKLSNKSITLSKNMIEAIIYTRANNLPQGIPIHKDNWMKQLNASGIYYSKDTGKFFIIEKY
jgi:hypothetical protein